MRTNLSLTGDLKKRLLKALSAGNLYLNAFPEFYDPATITGFKVIIEDQVEGFNLPEKIVQGMHRLTEKEKTTYLHLLMKILNMREGNNQNNGNDTLLSQIKPVEPSTNGGDFTDADTVEDTAQPEKTDYEDENFDMIYRELPPLPDTDPNEI